MDLLNLKDNLSFLNEPKSREDFNTWVQQKDVLPFLQEEIEDENIIIYAALPHAFIHAVFIPDVELNKSVVDDLLEWNENPYSGWGLSVSSDDAWIEEPLAGSRSNNISDGEQIIFARSFEGVESRRHYFELQQRISHVLGLHFMPERNAWCKLDKFGDIQDIVKVVETEDLPNNESGTIITANKDVLGEYAGVCNFLLCRTFDFTRFRLGGFSGWGRENKPAEFSNDKDIFGQMVVQNEHASYTRGVQVKNIGIPKEQIINNTWGKSSSEEVKQYATFIAHDWKNKRIAEISCDPSCLANYFTESDLPFTTTPAYFRPEVLLKYKSDQEKYSLENRSISCRGSWYLQTFDVNEAGQVHTYLGYLNRLPYEEQLHWKQYNERPKAPISKRAFATDFEGQFYEEYDPLLSLTQKLEKLRRARVGWWHLRGENALKNVHYPYTSSSDEWANEILNLDQLVIEGFEEKWLRRKATELGRKPDAKLRELKLTEQCLIGVGFEEDHAYKIMSPLHDIHNLRSIVKGHASGSEAAETKKQVLQNYGSFRKHFEYLCASCDESLDVLIETFDKLQS